MDNGEPFNIIDKSDVKKKPVYECNPCGYGPTHHKGGYNRHLKSKKHITKFGLEEEYDFNCIPCNLHTNREDYWNEHCALLSHLEKCELDLSEYVPNPDLYCEPCDFQTDTKKLFNIHLKRKTHLDEINGVDKNKYKCKEEKCDFKIDTIKKLKEHVKSEHSKSEKEIKQKQVGFGKMTTINGDKKEVYILNIYKGFQHLFRYLKRIGSTNCKFDIVFEFENELYLRGVQVKTISKVKDTNKYIMRLHKKQYKKNTLIIGVNIEDNIFCLIYSQQLKSESLYFNPEEKTNTDYFYTDLNKFKDKLIEKSKNTIIIDDITKYMTVFYKQEYESIQRLKVECIQLKLNFEENDTSSNEIDFFINKKRIQHKSSYCTKGWNSSYKFHLNRNNGRIEGKKTTRPYSNKDQIDYFIFEIVDKKHQNNFFIIPMMDLINHKYIKTDKQKGKEVIFLPSKNNWTSNRKNYWSNNFINQFEQLTDSLLIIV